MLLIFLFCLFVHFLSKNNCILVCLYKLVLKKKKVTTVTISTEALKLCSTTDSNKHKKEEAKLPFKKICSA